MSALLPPMDHDNFLRFRLHLWEAARSAERADAIDLHSSRVFAVYSAAVMRNFQQAAAAAGFSLIRTEDVIAATKIVEKADA